jgi:hypothetical protein
MKRYLRALGLLLLGGCMGSVLAPGGYQLATHSRPVAAQGDDMRQMNHQLFQIHMALVDVKEEVAKLRKCVMGPKDTIGCAY